MNCFLVPSKPGFLKDLQQLVALSQAEVPKNVQQDLPLELFEVNSCRTLAVQKLLHYQPRTQFQHDCLGFLEIFWPIFRSDFKKKFVIPTVHKKGGWFHGKTKEGRAGRWNRLQILCGKVNLKSSLFVETHTQVDCGWYLLSLPCVRGAFGFTENVLSTFLMMSHSCSNIKPIPDRYRADKLT